MGFTLIPQYVVVKSSFTRSIITYFHTISYVYCTTMTSPNRRWFICFSTLNFLYRCDITKHYKMTRQRLTWLVCYFLNFTLISWSLCPSIYLHTFSILNNIFEGMKMCYRKPGILNNDWPTNSRYRCYTSYAGTVGKARSFYLWSGSGELASWNWHLTYSFFLLVLATNRRNVSHLERRNTHQEKILENVYPTSTRIGKAWKNNQDSSVTIKKSEFNCRKIPGHSPRAMFYR